MVTFDTIDTQIRQQIGTGVRIGMLQFMLEPKTDRHPSWTSDSITDLLQKTITPPFGGGGKSRQTFQSMDIVCVHGTTGFEDHPNDDDLILWNSTVRTLLLLRTPLPLYKNIMVVINEYISFVFIDMDNRRTINDKVLVELFGNPPFHNAIGGMFYVRVSNEEQLNHLRITTGNSRHAVHIDLKNDSLIDSPALHQFIWRRSFWIANRTMAPQSRPRRCMQQSPCA
jgi:hypothetical protein